MNSIHDTTGNELLPGDGGAAAWPGTGPPVWSQSQVCSVRVWLSPVYLEQCFCVPSLYCSLLFADPFAVAGTARSGLQVVCIYTQVYVLSNYIYTQVYTSTGGSREGGGQRAKARNLGAKMWLGLSL